MGLTETATRKVGPLPAWGWGAIAVGGFVAWRMFGGSGGNGTTDAGVPSVGAPGDLGSGGGGGGGSSGAVDTTKLQAAIDNLTARIGNVTIPGTGGGGGGGGGGGTTTVANPGDSVGAVNTPGYIAGTVDQATTAAFQAINAYKLQLIDSMPGNTPYSVVDAMVRARFGGAAPQGGPETVLTTSQYKTLILGQYPGQTPDLLTNPNASYDVVAWYNYLVSIGPEGYVGVNSGQRDDAEYFRNLSIAKKNAEAALAGNPISGIAQVGDVLAPPSTSGGSGAPASVPYSGSILDKLRGYIANLQGDKTRTAAQESELQMYQQRLATYTAANAGALASGSPPTISSTPSPTAGISAPSTAAAPVDYSKAIATVQGYIANLSAVQNPTTAQRTELAMYQARLADYQSR